ncbi:GTPase HflX [Halarchaeum sp. CBA1220]|uniref:GTPase HflX n=1 Tax=Halarchaeum sp. CBA1220 TaxID=1853682 RepID=UPI000F3AA458|nr:GTPase HflX [Halarchaeum sp. CBA1220]QLC34623.1 GTPase HflX [Halarchaeum sp. CBA1220]
MTGATTGTVVVAKRVDDGEPDTDEITELVRAAGYEVAGEVTQSRTADPALQLGEGKVAELATRVADTGADTVVFDNRLGPYQRFNLGGHLPDGTEVMDRFTLILEIFGQRAQTRKAQLQVELAELRYELPRAEAKASLAKRDERPGFMGLGEYDESREQDIKAQISRIRDELENIETTERHRREQRRESGFDLVALAGYTSAGKSTLMRALADDLDLDENEERHPDLETTAESRDELFTTLGTTTRRMDIDERDVLLTDTVGFISDLPHWLVESFKSTLDSVYQADLVLLVVDASEPVEEIREKLATSHDTLYERNEAPILTVFNKVDRVPDDELAEKREALSALAPNPIAVSALTEVGLDELRERVDYALPRRERERLVLPMTEETMSVVSWVHDNASVEEVTYGDEEVVVEFEARPKVIEQSRAKASELASA